ncbi:uncharacterized protein LOC122512615 [Leptopilina heterotoma]|uniref:uncharacterized protein LOC122512615 n=1 Tax=Leptopilina heterotoma TaxID=63436 RepID=UPI001CA8E76C|nr:uncharacterized protein LOC122512615 [Leptopilina heterotoma]
METGNFTSPLQAVQMVSIFTYLNTLSDVLFVDNLLNETNQYQPIPVVNALYKYFFNLKKIEIEKIEFRKRRLARKLIEGTDLYGAKENEILDEAFIDALYRHLITTLVFEKYGNIQGFLLDVVRHSRDLRISTLQEKIITRLSEEEFQSENGFKSQLDFLSIFKIYQDFIQPLFPVAGKDTDLLSVDYIYAQAGAAFRLSTKTESLIVPRKYEHGKNDDFNSYVVVGHTIEHLGIAKEIDEAALQVFSLPALFYYVTKRAEKLQGETTAAIVNNPKHVSKALRILFFHLKETFDRVEKARNDDYRLQFYSARSKFKNRTALAREMIRTGCPIVKEENLEQEVLRYKNNPEDYECRTEGKTQGTIGTKLEDLNRIYQQKVNEVAEKYLKYEVGSIRDAFGEDRIRFIDANEVEVSRGLVVNVYDGTNVIQTQLVKESADLFRFYFVKNDTSIYYAIVREDDNLMVIQQDDGVSDGCNDSMSNNTSGSARTDGFQPSIIHCNPNDFREKLNLPPSQKFRDINFPDVKKHKLEKFDIFLTRISRERSTLFNKSLADYGYEQTKKEWWKQFGLSFVPFYNCIHGIHSRNIEETEIACSLDVLIALPLVGEVGYLATKLTTAFTRSVIYSAGTTLGSLGLRTIMRGILAKLGSVGLTEAEHFTVLFNQQTFRNVGLSFLRYVDPGFELIYTIGKGGLRAIRNLITEVITYSISLEGVLIDLVAIESKIEKLLRIVDTNSDVDVFVNSLNNPNGGYGFKFIHLPNNRVA